MILSWGEREREKESERKRVRERERERERGRGRERKREINDVQNFVVATYSILCRAKNITALASQKMSQQLFWNMITLC